MGLKRNEKYDFYRGLLMLGVVWGHTITALRFGLEGTSSLLHFFRTYDMPMFAFISGFFLNKSIQKNKFSTNILKKIGMILIPVLLWNVIFEFITLRILHYGVAFSFSRFWFLWSIFITSIIALIIEKLFNFSRFVKFIVYTTVIIATHTVIDLPFNVPFLLIPCIFGMYYDSMKNKFLCNMSQKNIKIIKGVFIAVFIIMQFFWDKSYNVWNTGNNIFAFSTPLITSLRVFFRTSIGLVGCIAMMTIFNFLYGLLYEKIRKAVCAVGKNTLEIYIIQNYLVEFLGAYAVMYVTNKLGFNIFGINMFLLDYVFAFVISSVSILCSYYVQKWLKLLPGVGSTLFGTPMKRKKVAQKNSVQIGT